MDDNLIEHIPIIIIVLSLLNKIKKLNIFNYYF